MCMLYLLSPGIKARMERGRISIEKDGKKINSVLLSDVESVVLGKCAAISTPLIFEILSLGKNVFYVDGLGNLRGHLGDEQNTVERLMTQINYFADETYKINLIRRILEIKLCGQLEIVTYYAKKNNSSELAVICEALHIYKRKINQEIDSEKLRGLEGVASKTYFEAFCYILDQDKWQWLGRNRRPALDPVNAMLNYGYAFLEREIRVAIVGTGLDARIGFLHSNNGRKDSLVFDLMEMFRQKIIDHLVLKMLNRMQIQLEDFQMIKGCRLTDKGRNKWIMAYEKEMDTEMEFFSGKCPREYIRQEIKKFATDFFQAAACSA